MTPEQAVELRKPFAPESVGKLPRVTCRACRDAKGNCGDHRKVRCEGCGNWITAAHIHLDYVGHAEITDRLLTVDPGWTWEPAALGQDGLPQMGHGGLWIRLTVAGVTRLGFGSADGKTGPDAVKEMIGDALRNAAMRFGVGLDLWGAKFKGGEDGHHDAQDESERAVQRNEAKLKALEAAAENSRNEEQLKTTWGAVLDAVEADELTDEDAQRLSRLIKERKAQLAPPPESASPPAVQQHTVALTSDGTAPTEKSVRYMHALFRELGYTQDAKYAVMSRVTGRDITSASQLTGQDVDAIIVDLKGQKAKLARRETADATT